MNTEMLTLSEEGVEPAAPIRFGPRATRAVAALVVVSFIVEVILSAQTLTGLLSPSVSGLVALGGISRDLVVQEGEWWRLIAGPFLHADLMHLLMNVVVLVFAGGVVEERLGAARWLVIYGLGATGGALASTFVNEPNIVSVGASGAVMALLSAMFMLSFGERETEVRNSMMTNSLRFLVPSMLPFATRGMAVDLSAHIGGAVTGLALGFVFLREPASRPLTALSQALAGVCVGAMALGGVLTLIEVPALLVVTEQSPLADTTAWLSRACDLHSNRACVTLGRALASGEALSADAPRAVSLLRGPCFESSDVGACFSLGFAATKLQKPDRKMAIDAYERACTDDSAACFNLALLLQDEPQVEAGRIGSLFERGCPTVPGACKSAAIEFQNEPERALPLARRGCDANDGYSCWLAAKWVADGAGAPGDAVGARALHAKACELGDAFGCNSLGVFWLQGKGGPSDAARSVTLFEKGCGLKDSQSCTNLALSLTKGQGVKADATRARQLFLTACEAGNSQACDNALEGCRRTECRARRELLIKACDAGAGAACRWLAWFADEGVGEPVDKSVAAELFARACKEEDGSGCYWHSEALRVGEGVAHDIDKATEERARACVLGFQDACEK